MDFFSLAKPLIFSLDPEKAHNMAIAAMELGVVKHQTVKPTIELNQNLFGLNFPHPLGMAAGFDKDAKVFGPLFNLGFSFVEVGTITPKAQTGNDKPRLFRLIKDEAIINRMGFNNNGHEAALKNIDLYYKFQNNKLGILGINIGANKDTEDKIEDYEKGILKFAHLADFITVNISSPNTPGLRLLQKKDEMHSLIERIFKAREKSQNLKVPLLIKLAPDLDYEELKAIAGLALEFKIDGVIISNTTLSRDNLKDYTQAEEKGGLSGKPLLRLSNKILAQFYLLTFGKIPIIGVGGISSAEDALLKIEAGASLVELYSAFVFKGPELINDIVSKLPNLLKEKDYTNITSAIGKKSNSISETKI